MRHFPTSRIESLVDFIPTEAQMELVKYRKWGNEDDFAHVRFTSINVYREQLEYFVSLNAKLSIELHWISSETKDIKLKSVFREGHEIFLPNPLPLTEASQHGARIEKALIKEIDSYELVVSRMVEAITGDNWEAKPGHPGSDLQYAILAHLFVTLQKYSWEKVRDRLAERLDLPKETAKTRLKSARDRGLLTSPGMGSTNSQLTPKSKKLLIKEHFNVD